MNPNPGEPVNPSGGVATADKPVPPVTESPLRGTPTVPSSTDLSRVENLVAAAQQEAAAVQGAMPGQPGQEAPVSPSQEQFRNQFDPQPTAPVQQPVPDLMAAALEGLGTQTPSPLAENSTDVKLDPSINTVADLLAKGPQVVELKSEVKLPPKVQEFLDSVLNAADKYKASEEVTKDEVPA